MHHFVHKFDAKNENEKKCTMLDTRSVFQRVVFLSFLHDIWLFFYLSDCWIEEGIEGCCCPARKVLVGSGSGLKKLIVWSVLQMNNLKKNCPKR